MFLIVKELYQAGIANGQYCITDTDGITNMFVVKQDDLYQGFLIDNNNNKIIKKTPVVNDLRILNHLLEKIVGGKYNFVKA